MNVCSLSCFGVFLKKLLFGSSGSTRLCLAVKVCLVVAQTVDPEIELWLQAWAGAAPWNQRGAAHTGTPALGAERPPGVGSEP